MNQAVMDAFVGGPAGTRCGILVGVVERVDGAIVRLRLEGAEAPDDAETIAAVRATEARVKPGDQGIVAGDGAGRAFLIGVVRRTAERPGSDPGEVNELRDDSQRLVARYDRAGGALTICSETDVVVAAPAGRIILASRDGVGIATPGPVHVDGSRIEARAGASPRGAGGETSVALRPGSARVRALGLDLRAERAGLECESLSLRAGKARADFGKLDMAAKVLRQRATEITTVVTGVLATHAGRIRQVAQGAFSLRAERTTLRSRRDTKIDGEKIHIG